jgi:hypothetical protein
MTFPQAPTNIGFPPSQVEATTVIISTAVTGSTGIFVYNGTPGAGNIPVLAIVAPGVTTDPFGNTVAAILSINGTAGQSILFKLVAGLAQEIFSTGAAIEGTAANIASAIISSGLTEYLEWLVSGPKLNVAGFMDWTQIQLVSSTAGGTANAQGALIYIDNAQVPHTVMVWGGVGGATFFQPCAFENQGLPASQALAAVAYGGSGQLKYVGSDGTAYNTGRITLVSPGQTISVIAQTTITGLTCQVGIGSYRFSAYIVFNGNVAARITNAVSAPATSQAVVSYMYFNAGGAVAVSQVTTVTLGAGALGPSMTAANQVLLVEGTAVFTAAGQFALTAATSIAADNLVIVAGSYLDVYPIT